MRGATVSKSNTPAAAVLEKLSATFDVLGGDVLGIVTDRLLGEEAAGGLEARLVELFIQVRNSLRKAKNFEAADTVRSGLADIGVELMDGPEGTTWKRL